MHAHGHGSAWSRVTVAHFSPRLTVLAKMSLSWAQNIFMRANINSIVLIIKSYLTVKLKIDFWMQSLAQTFH